MQAPTKMFIWALFCLSLVYTVVSQRLTFCYQEKQCYEVNDMTFSEKWKTQLNHRLDNISEIRVHDLHLNEQNYQILFSHKLPNVKKIIFWSHQSKSARKQFTFTNPLTPKIVETIFKSAYFAQLEELDLSYTNLDYRHFSFLQNTESVISSNLNILILTGNYLEQRAFNLLERINFNGKINSLALSQNSLISPQTIKSILKMIKSHDGSKSNLTNITVYNTQITSEGMIELLENIKVEEMVNLNLARNPFQHSKKFSIPFNNSFYSFLSKSNFSSLKRLCLTQLDLDEQQLPYFKNFKLQSLETLQLTTNFITDDYFGSWITKQNMPKLNALHLQQNSISDLAIKFLAEQNFSNLTELRLAHNRKLTPKHLHYLAMINSSKWTYLDLSRNSVLQNSLRALFQNRSFDNLVDLKMESSSDCYRIFEFLPWQSMGKLQYLQMFQTDFSWTVNNIANQKISFPSLRKFAFGGNWMTKYHLKTVVANLKQFGPQLELVEILPSVINENTMYVNLSELNPDTVPKGMYLYNLGFMTVRMPQKGSKFEVIELTFGNQQYNFIQSMFHYSFFESYEETDSDYAYTVLHDSKQLTIALEYLDKIVSFEKLQMCVFSEGSEFNLFRRIFFTKNPKEYFQEYKKFVQSNVSYKASVYMPYLKRINYVLATNKTQESPYLYYMTKMEMPLLLSVTIATQNHKQWIKLGAKLFQQQNNIRQIILMGNKLNCEKLNKLIEGRRFPYLKKLLVTDNQIEKECLKHVIDRHRLIRDLDISKNFLESGVFNGIIATNNLILKNLQFSLMQIGNQQFSELATVNRQFILTLQAESIAIDSLGILWLVGNNTAQSLFPRCIQIHFGNNNINETGVQALLQTGMPFMKHISFSRSDNPNLMNNLLSYPNQFMLISIKTDTIYGFNTQIDPRSTRHVTNLQIQSSSLTLQDYKVLSEMNFNNLEKAILTFQNIYECQVLNYILKIVQNTDAIGLFVINEKIKGRGMSDSCIDKYNSSQIYMRNLDKFNIIWAGQYFYIPNFYTYFYSPNQLVTILVLENCLIGDDQLIHIVQNCNIEHLWGVVLVNNLLTSKSIQKFFSKQWTLLKHLDLSNNMIGSQAFSNITNKSFNDLTHLGLQQNQIDNKGIQYLTRAQFLSLTKLILDGNDLTREGFVQIFKMNAPKLTIVSVKNNLMTENDLVWALEKISIDKFPFLTIIRTSINVGWKNAQRLTKLKDQKFKKPGFTIVYEEFYLETINKAIL